MPTPALHPLVFACWSLVCGCVYGCVRVWCSVRCFHSPFTTCLYPFWIVHMDILVYITCTYQFPFLLSSKAKYHTLTWFFHVCHGPFFRSVQWDLPQSFEWLHIPLLRMCATFMQPFSYCLRLCLVLASIMLIRTVMNGEEGSRWHHYCFKEKRNFLCHYSLSKWDLIKTLLKVGRTKIDTFSLIFLPCVYLNSLFLKKKQHWSIIWGEKHTHKIQQLSIHEQLYTIPVCACAVEGKQFW